MQNDVRFKYDDKEVDPYSNPYYKVGVDYVVNFEFPTMNIEVESEVTLVDVNDFVSATGGALGLFLGFSIIDTLFYMYDFIWRKVESTK